MKTYSKLLDQDIYLASYDKDGNLLTMSEIDYDVMVFVRCEPTFCFWKNVDQLYRNGDKAIIIAKKSWYLNVRDGIITNGRSFISEIQLIRPKHA